ncbi:MAG: hypothetical protein ACRDK2_14205, partial [Solirubrobacteraceae bacterium]
MAANEAGDVHEALEEALQLIGPDCQATYLRNEPHVRRLMNQAIFECLVVTPDDIKDDPQPVVADLQALAQGVVSAPKTAKESQKDRGHQFLGGHGSHFDTLVR